MTFPTYHALVRRRVRGVFQKLSESDWQPILDDTAEDVHHVFPGDHPLGGERHTRVAVAHWFDRLGRLFPGHQLEVRRVVSRGWPWSTWVAVSWTARLETRKGQRYANEGAHWIHLRWGKVTHIHAYLDTQRVAEACEAMARAGVKEAALDPIRD